MAKLKWWQSAVFYQIYPRSFADGNGDGVGDFSGIISRLDYLHELGIGAIWLSPHFPSPFLDCGYDITDYSAVAPEYGTLEDFRRFLAEAHARDIRVVLDLVLNHTSDQHPWFQESRSSRETPKRDWYIWRDAVDGQPPNNWASIFGGTAWKYDSQTDQYYYHVFLEEQPDLNWRNPEVKQAMWEAVRFWLDLGVDGFRLDAVATIFEDEGLPDHSLNVPTHEIIDANALNPTDYRTLLKYQLKQPGLHELLQELRTVLDEYPGDRVLIGEDEDVAFHGSGDNELHLVFNFPLMQLSPLTPAGIHANQKLRLAQLPPEAWPCNTLGNHDSSRLLSRHADGQHDADLARLCISLMLTLRGTPFLYYGEEIGMTDLRLAGLAQMRDLTAVNLYKRLTEVLGVDKATALDQAIAATRDRCRTPMQWEDSPTAGFSPVDITPWLPVNPSYRDGINVAAQKSNPASLLSFYRTLIQIRQSTEALLSGSFEPVDAENPFCLTFVRRTAAPDRSCLIALNFSDRSVAVISGMDCVEAAILLAYPPRTDKSIELKPLQIPPYGILIVQLQE